MAWVSTRRLLQSRWRIPVEQAPPRPLSRHFKLLHPEPFFERLAVGTSMSASRSASGARCPLVHRLTVRRSPGRSRVARPLPAWGCRRSWPAALARDTGPHPRARCQVSSSGPYSAASACANSARPDVSNPSQPMARSVAGSPAVMSPKSSTAETRPCSIRTFPGSGSPATKAAPPTTALSQPATPTVTKPGSDPGRCPSRGAARPAEFAQARRRPGADRRRILGGRVVKSGEELAQDCGIAVRPGSVRSAKGRSSNHDVIDHGHG
jgi:hypothetical protein